jgi:hypothetical protein
MRGSVARTRRIGLSVGLIAMIVIWPVAGPARAGSVSEPLPVLHLHPSRGPVGTLVNFDAALTPNEVRFVGKKPLRAPLLIAGDYPVKHYVSKTCDLVLATTHNQIQLDRTTGRLRGHFTIGTSTTCSQSRGAARPVPVTGFGVQFPCAVCNVAVFHVTATPTTLPFSGFPTAELLLVAAIMVTAGGAMTSLARPHVAAIRALGRHRAGPRHRR